MSRKILFVSIVLVVGMLLNVVSAQEDTFKEEHPQTYVVQEGDTLWDIAQKFLNTPWAWPEIWHANPQVENPHLIYPGDTISLVYIDGQQKLTAQRGDNSIVKLSPSIRSGPSNEAIPTIQLEDIKAYLTKPRMLSVEEIKTLPYIVAVKDDEIYGKRDSTVYVRGLEAQLGDRVAIARPGLVYYEVPKDYLPPYDDGVKLKTDSWNAKGGYAFSQVWSDLWKVVTPGYQKRTRVLGHEAIVVGEAEVISVGDPSTLLIVAGKYELRKGDLIVPINDEAYEANFQLSALEEAPANIRVIAMNESVYGAGKFQVVAVNKGSEDGLMPGHIFEAYRPGKTIRDNVKYPKGVYHKRPLFKKDKRHLVTLPDEYAAQVMIFKTFDAISYAIVLKGRAPVRLFDKLISPKQTI